MTYRDSSPADPPSGEPMQATADESVLERIVREMRDELPAIRAATSRQASRVALCASRPRMPRALSRAYCASASGTHAGGMLSAAVFR